VAQLAGLPPAVLERAREVLAELESERTAEHLDRAAGSRGRKRADDPSQLGLFAPAEHPLAAELRALELERLTPLEALNRLAEWKKRWGGG
jgi:DNA mismatch repair protein MutS